MKHNDSFFAKPSFKRDLLYSVAGHLCLILLFFVFSYFDRWKPPTPTQITWIQLGGGMGEAEGLPFKEVKTLPKTTIEEQRKARFEQPPLPTEKPPPVVTKPEPKPVGPEKEKIAIEDPSKKPKKELPKESEKKETAPRKEDPRILNALAKINEDLKERTPIPEAAQVKEAGQGDPNGSPGGSNSECGLYSAKVKQRILGNWIRITGGNKPPRPPKIAAMINESGNVISTQWIQKSGDLSLDSSALRAITSSSPLPAPPVNCQVAVREGLAVQFGK